jgi:hypothetical protein
MLSIASFVTGSVLRYLTIYPELAVILIGFGADLVAVTNFFKKFVDTTGEDATVTTNFYYNCVLYTCLIITLGQFGVGVWYIVAGITELAMTLITSAILMTTLSVFIKRQQSTNETLETKIVPVVEDKPVIVDLKAELVEKPE